MNQTNWNSRYKSIKPPKGSEDVHAFGIQGA